MRGEDLRQLRVRAHPRITQTELARVLGIDRATVWLWETREVLDDERAARYEAALARILASRNIASKREAHPEGEDR